LLNSSESEIKRNLVEDYLNNLAKHRKLKDIYSYNFSKYIKTMKQIQIISDGNLETLYNNVNSFLSKVKKPDTHFSTTVQADGSGKMVTIYHVMIVFNK